MVEDNTLYITGADVSAESGIPTFRGGSLTWQGDYYEAKDAIDENASAIIPHRSGWIFWLAGVNLHQC